MSDDISPRHYDDDVDLLALLVTLWRDKFLIIASAALPLLIGVAISLTSESTFTVTAPYTVMIKELDETSLPSRIARLSENEWAVSGKKDPSLEHSTRLLRPLAEYQDDLAHLNQLLRQLYLEEAQALQHFTESESFQGSRQTEAAAMSLVETQRIIFFLDEKKMTPLLFDKNISISRSTLIFKISLAVAIAGALMACVFVLLRKGLQVHFAKKTQS